MFRLRAVAPERALVHVLDGSCDALRAGPIVSALETMGAFRQVVLQLGPPECPSRASGAAVETRAVAAQPHTAEAVIVVDAELTRDDPVAAVIYGDSDLAVAAAVAAARRGVPIARVNGGHRSFSRVTPGEVNRALIDGVADVVFASTPDGMTNLLAEGVPAGHVHHSGSTVVDALRRDLPTARARAGWQAAGVTKNRYVLVALRRAVPVPLAMAEALRRLSDRGGELIADCLPTDAAAGVLSAAGVRSRDVTDALDALSLRVGAAAIITDCSCVAEEAAALGVPAYDPSGALTPCDRSGAPMLLGAGWETLLDVDAASRPALPLWDGRAATRIAQTLVATYALARISHSA